MTQITGTKLDGLNVLQLYQHYGALERSLPLLTPESQDLAKSELETCARLRSEKIDRIYYALSHHEDSVERAKKEKLKLQEAQKHHESQVRQLKELVKYLRRGLPLDTNKITGRNYQFTVSKRKELAVEVKTDPKLWEPEEQQAFCIEQEICTTKRTVVRSMSGEVLEERTEPKTTTEILPNLDAIRDAHKDGRKLPDGVKVIQEYSIRTRRIVSNDLEVEAPEYLGQSLPETGTSDGSGGCTDQDAVLPADDEGH